MHRGFAIVPMTGALMLGQFAGAGPARAAEAQLIERRIQAVDAIIAKGARWDGPVSPGCSVAVSQNGRAVLSRSYGLANIEHRVPNGPGTVFAAASISKTFTAVAILMLARDGRLSLDDDVRRYVPELPAYSRPITIDQLLNHTNGLRDWGVLADVMGASRTYHVYTNLDVLDLLHAQGSLNFEPGTNFNYNNSDYVVLAQIVERVSGAPFPKYVHDNIFAPLGMSASAFHLDHGETADNQASGYARAGDRVERTDPLDDVYGPSGLVTTAADLLIWSDALDSGKLGPFVTARLGERAALTGGRPIVYSRGQYHLTYRGLEQVFHGGAIPGFSGWVGRYPQRRLSVALLCNMGTDSDGLAQSIAEVFLDLPPSPAAAAAPSPVPDAATRAGLYFNTATGLPLRLVADGGGLRKRGVPLVRDARGELSDGDDTYRFAGPGELEVSAWEGPRRTYRLSPAGAQPPADLHAYARRYRSRDLGVTYVVAEVDHKLVLQLENRSEVSYPLKFAAPDTFVAGGYLITFQRGANGEVTALSFHHDRVWDLRFDAIA